MKKSIKYAGIAAATLLAVAPVAAPVVSQAADSTVATTPDYNKQQNSADAFKASLNTETAASNLVSGTSVKGVSVEQGSMKIDAFNTAEAGLVKAAIGTTDINNIGDSAKVTVSAKTVKGAAINTDYDLGKILADSTQPEVEFTVTLSFTNTNGKADSRTATVKATKKSTVAKDDMTSAKATFTTPLSVALNTTVTSSTLDASNDAKIVDQNGNSVLTDGSKVKAGTSFFTTYSNAIEAAKAGNEDSDAAGVASSVKADTNVEPNGTKVFTKAGTYYQVITFTGATGTALNQFVKNYNLDPSTYSVYVNGSQASAGYDFVADTTDAANTTLKFVRAINVSNTTDQWTTTDTTGVVTTKTASNYYTLKNDSNQTIANRALGANTPWRTDKVRTNQDGVKQYRVATGEWIDADNVVYSNGNNNSNNGSGLTDIKTVSGVATLTKAKGYYMALFNDEGKAYDNKYLGSPSAWRVDRTAKGADGNTYYRVATSEWLQAGEGVSFK
ncbi:hypothetical protein [Companilactobacillus kimchii]|uniref:Surface layer protein A domain-containing protein n=2 Tax=Companilactobacillus kimchii TaxID=2801452 RepID=A0ABR5NS99_9LACO|nr:hypothetical protein [Companilactobacillus kimchii]KAE9557853.1 hypothetical protein ATN91_03565 [Companilactobacillus kimchii]KRK50988.1 hypothetical protein FC97_GL001273 [Companilactobacillus kimchii DSM 13961 = JCM 10707]OWF33684.1 Platelet binding protein GspB [Companilactobacillus kimchii]GEO48275.1 hypothetical protein LKI01_22740 [Companilactobacillus paralimentarius]